jgi:DNA repair exonuclease SbcCD ATPase subunit
MSLTKEIINKYFAPQFDIDKFLASTPKERSKMLQKLAGIDFTAIDTEYKIAYEQRTYANRVLKDAHAKQVPIFHTLEEEKIIDITQLQEDIALTMKNNMDIANAQDRCDKIKSEIVELEKKITTLQEEANYHYNTILKLPIVDISKKEQAFKDAMAHNEKALELRKQREANAAYISAETQALIAEEAVKIIEQKKKDMLKASNLPDGIAIEEDGVTVDGFALDKSQISTSKLYITALKLAALNLADVKCLTFDASPLDKNSLEDIQEWAFKNDLQLLIEKPDFDGGEIQYQLIEEVAHAE